MAKQSIQDLPCLCASFRRSARVLTQIYDQVLRPHGLRATQFTVLQALSLAREIRQRELGRLLGMDSTTLTRTLEIMDQKEKGWIASRTGEDRRERWLSLTKAGEARFNRALPQWMEVQDELRRKFGNERWGDLMNLTNEVTDAVKDLGGPQ
jgi:DNA-binding MarR family transcriptional regulator